jgi:hypothetical protein
MKNRIVKIGMVFGLVALLFIPSVSMNVSAGKTADDIEKEAEARLGIQLTTFYKDDTYVNIDLLLIPDAYSGVVGEETFYEAYYNGRSTAVKQRFVQEKVWHNSSRTTSYSGFLPMIHIAGVYFDWVWSAQWGDDYLKIWTFGCFRQLANGYALCLYARGNKHVNVDYYDIEDTELSVHRYTDYNKTVYYSLHLTHGTNNYHVWAEAGMDYSTGNAWGRGEHTHSGWP